MVDLAELARGTLASNRFMVLGTLDPSGRPRVSPVWFSLVDHQEVYWLSSPNAHHSRNIGVRPEVSMVVFNSAADPHTGQAVYLEATAGRVPGDELADACASAFRGVDRELAYTPESRTSRSCSIGRESRPRRSTCAGVTSMTAVARTSVFPSSSERCPAVLTCVSRMSAAATVLEGNARRVSRSGAESRMTGSRRH